MEGWGGGNTGVQAVSKFAPWVYVYRPVRVIYTGVKLSTLTVSTVNQLKNILLHYMRIYIDKLTLHSL